METKVRTKLFFKLPINCGFAIIIALITFLYFSNNLNAVVTDCPNVISNPDPWFPSDFDSYIDPILFSGRPSIDYEGQSDITSVSGPSGSNDLSGGCPSKNANATLCPDMQCNPDNSTLMNPTDINTCGNKTTAFAGFFDPDSDIAGGPPNGQCDDPNTGNGTGMGAGNGNESIVVRMRLNGNPKNGNKNGFESEIWQVLFDIPVVDSDGVLVRSQDGWNDFLLSINGKFDQGNPDDDQMQLFFNNGVNNLTQNCDTAGGNCFLIDTYSACATEPTCTMDLGSGPDCTASFTRSSATINDDPYPEGCINLTGDPVADCACNGNQQCEEYYLDIRIPISDFVDNNNNTQQIDCSTNINVVFSTSTTVQDTFLKDSQPDCVSNQECDTGDFTPVLLSYFSSKKTGEGVIINWSTDHEASNAGFNLYEQKENGFRPVNETIILSKVIDTELPTDYVYNAKNLASENLYISDIDLTGRETFHGPFTINKEYGERGKIELIDWNTIKTEHDSKQTKRLNTRKQIALNKIKKNKNLLIKTSTISVSFKNTFK